MARTATFRIGTSGWQYDHWRGVFYPEDLPKGRWFDHYARQFDTVEINNTFYHLPADRVFDAWRERAPEGFCYILKFSRYGTHIKRLTEAADTVYAFMERANRLGNLLGPILVQLPPRWSADPERLAAFLAETPSGQRWAVEFRDASWLNPEVYQVLRAYRAALCIHDLIEEHPRVLTADWAYLRYHGGADNGNYSSPQLADAAGEIREYLNNGLDVFAYFNNDLHGYAVQNARDLRSRVLSTTDIGERRLRHAGDG